MVHVESRKRFIENRQKEYDYSVAKGGTKVGNHSGLSENANFVGKHYVLTIKNPNTVKELFKARWVFLGHQDELWPLISNESPMLLHMSLSIILSLVAVFFLSMLWLLDLKKSFMQLRQLTRSVFAEILLE